MLELIVTNVFVFIFVVTTTIIVLSHHNALHSVNPLIATLKPQSNGPSYSNTVIGTLATDGLAVTFRTVRRGLGGVTARPRPFSLY